MKKCEKCRYAKSLFCSECREAGRKEKTEQSSTEPVRSITLRKTTPRSRSIAREDSTASRVGSKGKVR
jgi:hypothetical protein